MRAGQLLECKLEVIGMFLGGCNEDWTEKAQEQTGVKKSAQKKMRVFISNGKQDTVSTVEHAEKLRDNLEGKDYAAVEMDLFEGQHTINQESYAKGLAWLKEPTKK
jgi:predicted esterase